MCAFKFIITEHQFIWAFLLYILFECTFKKFPCISDFSDFLKYQDSGVMNHVFKGAFLQPTLLFFCIHENVIKFFLCFVTIRVSICFHEQLKVPFYFLLYT